MSQMFKWPRDKSSYLHKLVCLFLSTLGGPLSLSGNVYPVRETSHFTLHAENREQNAIVADICHALLQVVGDHVSAPSSFTPHIRVEVKPIDGPPYRIFIESGGRVLLELNWSQSLEIRSVCVGLAQAFYHRLGIWQGGSDGWSRYPEWLVTGSAVSLENRLFPGVLQATAWGLREQPAIPLSYLLAYNPDPSEERWYADQSIYLLRFLRHQLRSRERYRQYLLRIVNGESAFEVLAGMLDIQNPALLEMRWMVWLEYQARLDLGPHYSLAESRRLVTSMDSIMLRQDEVDRLALFSELAKDESVEGIATEAERRLFYLKQQLPHANPAAFNTLHALGAILEWHAGLRIADLKGLERAYQMEWEQFLEIEAAVAGNP